MARKSTPKTITCMCCEQTVPEFVALDNWIAIKGRFLCDGCYAGRIISEKEVFTQQQEKRILEIVANAISRISISSEQ